MSPPPRDRGSRPGQPPPTRRWASGTGGADRGDRTSGTAPPTCHETALGGNRFVGPGVSSSHGDGWCRDGFNHVSSVGDLDLAGLGLLSDRDGEGKHTVLVVGSDVIAVQALAEEQLPAELAVESLGDLDLITLGPDPGPCRPHGEK